ASFEFVMDWRPSAKRPKGSPKLPWTSASPITAISPAPSAAISRSHLPNYAPRHPAAHQKHATGADALAPPPAPPAPPINRSVATDVDHGGRIKAECSGGNSAGVRLHQAAVLAGVKVRATG